MKPEGGTAPHSHTHIEQINTQSIGSSDTIALTYVQYTSDHFKRFPKHTLTIAEQNVVFLVDSGATHSVIRALELTTKPRLSGKHVYSVGSSGHTERTSLSHLNVRTDHIQISNMHFYSLKSVPLISWAEI